MRRKVREALAGYAFSVPILLTIAIFTVIPIIQAFYYSFTDYDALKQQMFNSVVDRMMSVGMYLGLLPEEVKIEEALKNFDPVEFVESMLGTELPERYREALRENFESERLIRDYVAGRLSGEVEVGRFISEYMRRKGKMFTRYKPEVVGFRNFVNMFNDEYFWIALKNSFVFSLVVTPIQTFLALVLAVSANMRIRGVGFFKTAFFIPAITSSAAISMIFMLLYSKPGLINRILSVFGFQPVDWLNNPSTALPAVMAMNIWTTAGHFMITFLAGLQNIPRSIIEASIIDGANGWVRFWKITLPLLRPQLVFVVTMGVIGTLQVFDQIYFLIKSQENITMSMYIYQNAFRYGKMGYASALALVFFLIIFLVTLLQKGFMERNLEVM